MGKKTKKRVNRVIPSFELIVILAVFLTAVLSLAYYFSASDNLLSGYQTASPPKKTVDLTSQTEKSRDGMLQAGIQLARVKSLAQIYIGQAPSEEPTTPSTPPEISPAVPSGTTTPSEGEQLSQQVGPMQPFVPPEPSRPFVPSEPPSPVSDIGAETPSPIAEVSPTPEVSPSPTPEESPSPSPSPTPEVSPILCTGSLSIYVDTKSDAIDTSKFIVTTTVSGLQNCGGVIDVSILDSNRKAISGGERHSCTIERGTGCTSQAHTLTLSPGTYIADVFAKFNDGSSKTATGSISIAQEVSSFSVEGIEVIQDNQQVQPMTGAFTASLRNYFTGFFAKLTGAETASTAKTFTIKANKNFNLNLKIKNTGAPDDPSQKIKLQILKEDGTPFKVLSPKSKIVTKESTKTAPESLELSEKDKTDQKIFQLEPGNYKLKASDNKDKNLGEEYVLKAIAPVITASVSKLTDASGAAITKATQGEQFKAIVNLRNDGNADSTEEFVLLIYLLNSQNNVVEDGFSTIKSFKKSESKDFTFDFGIPPANFPPGQYKIKIMKGNDVLTTSDLTIDPQKEFTISITGDSEIKEGGNANIEVIGALKGEEDSTKYYFIFGQTKKGPPTEGNCDDANVNCDDIRTSTAGKASVQPLYQNVGNYEISVLGVSKYGRKATKTHSLKVNNIPPRANIGRDLTVNVGQVVPFNGGGSSAGPYDEMFYYWDVDASDGLSFGGNKETAELKADLQGQTPQTPPQSHKYLKPGIYTATLRVYDDDGTYGDDTLQVTVKEDKKPEFSVKSYNLNQGLDVIVTGSNKVTGKELYSDTPLEINVEVQNTGKMAGTVSSVKIDILNAAGVNLVSKQISSSPLNIAPAGVIWYSTSQISSLPVGSGNKLLVTIDGVKQPPITLPEVKNVNDKPKPVFEVAGYSLYQDLSTVYDSNNPSLTRDLYSDTQVIVYVNVRNKGNAIGKPSLIKLSVINSGGNKIPLDAGGALEKIKTSEMLSEIPVGYESSYPVLIESLPAGTGYKLQITVNEISKTFTFPNVKEAQADIVADGGFIITQTGEADITGFFGRNLLTGETISDAKANELRQKQDRGDRLNPEEKSQLKEYNIKQRTPQRRSLKPEKPIDIKVRLSNLGTKDATLTNPKFVLANNKDGKLTELEAKLSSATLEKGKAVQASLKNLKELKDFAVDDYSIKLSVLVNGALKEFPFVDALKVEPSKTEFTYSIFLKQMPQINQEIKGGENIEIKPGLYGVEVKAKNTGEKNAAPKEKVSVSIGGVEVLSKYTVTTVMLKPGEESSFTRGSGTPPKSGQQQKVTVTIYKEDGTTELLKKEANVKAKTITLTNTQTSAPPATAYTNDLTTLIEGTITASDDIDLTKIQIVTGHSTKPSITFDLYVNNEKFVLSHQTSMVGGNAAFDLAPLNNRILLKKGVNSYKLLFNAGVAPIIKEISAFTTAGEYVKLLEKQIQINLQDKAKPTPALPPLPTNLVKLCSNDRTKVTLSWADVPKSMRYLLRVDYVENNAPSLKDGWLKPNSEDFYEDDLQTTTYVHSIKCGKKYKWWVHSAESSRISDAAHGAEFECPCSSTPTPSPTVQPPEFTISITGDSEIKEGENANINVEGALKGEEDSTKYYFIFNQQPDGKKGPPTEGNCNDSKVNCDDIRTSEAGKASVQPLYTNVGNYEISVLGVSKGKKSTKTHSLKVTNIPPRANAGRDITVKIGQTVPFNGGGSSAGPYDEKFYYWDVDASDGLSFATDKERADLKGQAPQTPPQSHKYLKPGIYTATLRVYDDDGTYGDDTLQVTVTELADFAKKLLLPGEVVQVKFNSAFSNIVAGRIYELSTAAGGDLRIKDTVTLQTNSILGAQPLKNSLNQNKIYLYGTEFSFDDKGNLVSSKTPKINGVYALDGSLKGITGGGGAPQISGDMSTFGTKTTTGRFFFSPNSMHARIYGR